MSTSEWPEKCPLIKHTAGSGLCRHSEYRINASPGSEASDLTGELARRWAIFPAAERLFAAVTAKLMADHTGNGGPEAGRELMDAIQNYERSAK